MKMICQLGIGCGGRVHILLQPVTAANAYLQLPEMLETLSARRRFSSYP